MKTYQNKKTGVIILSDSELGGDWELVVTKTPKKTSKKVNEEKEVEE